MNTINLAYYGYLFDATGYGQAARSYIHALHQAGIKVTAVNLSKHARQVEDGLVEQLLETSPNPDFHLYHGIPPEWARKAFGQSNAIGMTVWETDTMPSQWRNILNHVVEVWLPSQYNVEVFSQQLHNSVFKLPHTFLPTELFPPGPVPKSLHSLNPDEFVFYSIFEWQERKHPLGLVEAFLRAFPTEKDVILVLKTGPQAQEIAHEAIPRLHRELKSKARIMVCCESWTEAEITRLHERGNCYVSLHRGEGWGYPLFEAARRGIPVMATAYSGPLEYLNPEHHQLVSCSLCPVRQSYRYFNARMKWAEPDLAEAVEKMRWVYHHRETVREQAAQAGERISQTYSVKNIGNLAAERLEHLLKKTQARRWSQLVYFRQSAPLRPPAPIPPEWFDHDYFETGIKSNWQGGYSWQLFSGLFEETARFFVATFPEANSYLDVGCAKGFLVRALRERGKDAWGVDFSPWAIAHADAVSQPFLHQIGIDDFIFERSYDVLVAFSLFESLTEEQSLEFLKRAREWVNQALVAIIPCWEADEAEIKRETDQDLSHITMRSRQWWHELLLRAGWKQDSLHKIAQTHCQQHPLPVRMGWPVFVYAP